MKAPKSQRLIRAEFAEALERQAENFQNPVFVYQVRPPIHGYTSRVGSLAVIERGSAPVHPYIGDYRVADVGCYGPFLTAIDAVKAFYA